MGCGGSTLAADGSIAPGKGEVKIEPDATEVEVMWNWDGDGKKVLHQVKVMPELPGEIAKLKDAKWETKSTGAPGEHVIKVPVKVMQQRWQVEMEGGPVNILYPGQTVPDLCKKIHEQHLKDPTKFPKLMNKAAKEDHPYKKNPDKAKSDCDNLINCVNPSQMDDDMLILKPSLVQLEDQLPGNNGTVSLSIEKRLGKWAEGAGTKPALSLPEKAAAVKDQPDKMMQALGFKEKAVTKGVQGGIAALCTAMGTTPADLLPDLDAMLDAANGKKPLADTPYDETAKWQAWTKERNKTEDEIEEARIATVKAELEEDKKNEADTKALDSNPDQLKKMMREKIESILSYAKEATKPLDEGSIKKGVRVLAKWKKFGFIEGEVDSSISTGVVNDNRTGLLTGDEVGERKEEKYCKVKFDDGDTCLVNITNIAKEITEPAKPETLTRGTPVRARFYNDIFRDGTIEGRNPDGTFIVKFSLALTQPDVKPQDIRPVSDSGFVSKVGFLLPKSFYNVTFTWLQAETDLTVALNIWRETDDDNIQTHALTSFKKKKKNPDGSSGEEIHGGYKVTIPVCRDRPYCYNFKVGDDYFVNFKDSVSEKGYRVLTLRAS
eukprot:TRINITY_DN36922_c0_g1_i1.p1 TRINITY_DN36922_c0_g1~~TRINITY_DN36922_c0_g1_i1.p1  ORF type:complete len:606 (+),score=162.76 TRINITY_DN36922_c0_g1_i1:42-1859(+)